MKKKMKFSDSILASLVLVGAYIYSAYSTLLVLVNLI